MLGRCLRTYTKNYDCIDGTAILRLGLSKEKVMSPNFKVNIFNQTYSIGSELGEAYIQELAAYVDGKMRTIADASSTVDTQKVATFAAMAIADELHSLRKDRGEREELLKEQAERCLTLVERALKQTE